MNFDAFVGGPFLWSVFLVFILGTAFRLVLSLVRLWRTEKSSRFRWWYFLLPYHKALAKRPVSGVTLYVFHTAMILVPVFCTGHVVLWEASRFGWSWAVLPDKLADAMTVFVVGMTLFFLLRRIVVRHLRRESSPADYALILITALPFLTGYLLAHGTFQTVSLVGEQMWTIHMLSGGIMLVAVVFLLCGVRLRAEVCTGCASCEVECPTMALLHLDKGKMRIIRYAHAQCVRCAGCVGTCPEEAAELKHGMGILKPSRQFPGKTVRTVELQACHLCGNLFAPAPQLNNLSHIVKDDYLRYCARCKNLVFRKTLTGPVPPQGQLGARVLRNTSSSSRQK